MLKLQVVIQQKGRHDLVPTSFNQMNRYYWI